jgi:hypothetical protein
MAMHPGVRATLISKTKWSKQTLSAKAKQKKRSSPMSTEEASYLLAHEAGVDIAKFLDADVVARIRTLMSHGAHAGLGPKVKPAAHVKVNGHLPREIRFPGEFKGKNPLLSNAKLQEAREMAAVFPLLSVIENSMRELIKRVMYAKYGENWWDTELTSGRLKGVHKTSADRSDTQDKKHFWHQRRGSHPIDYVDLGHLADIINGKTADFFPAVIPDQVFFASMMRELEPSRNVVCHMNPLEKGNIDDVKSWFRKWEKTLDAAIARDVVPPSPPEKKK